MKIKDVLTLDVRIKEDKKALKALIEKSDKIKDKLSNQSTLENVNEVKNILKSKDMALVLNYNYQGECKAKLVDFKEKSLLKVTGCSVPELYLKSLLYCYYTRRKK